MSEERDPLAPFDDDVVSRVAANHGVGVDRVRDLIVGHQRRTREFPGVDELVYEWRTRLPYDPLVTRTDDAYVLAVRAHVWEQYGDQMDLDAEAVGLLRAVHDRQSRRTAAEGTGSTLDGSAPMLLTRP